MPHNRSHQRVLRADGCASSVEMLLIVVPIIVFLLACGAGLIYLGVH